MDTQVQRTAERLWPDPGPGALLIDFVGEPLGVVLSVTLLTTLCLALGRRRLAVVVLASIGTVGVLSTVLKPVVDRTIHGEFLSYPSGHTATATVLALVIMLLLVDLLRAGQLAGILLILSGAGIAAAGMALSQVALGAHYPTDTLGGFCVALVVVPATAYLIDRAAGPDQHHTGHPAEPSPARASDPPPPDPPPPDPPPPGPRSG